MHVQTVSILQKQIYYFDDLPDLFSYAIQLAEVICRCNFVPT